MRLLIVLHADDAVVAENQIKELNFQMQRLCVPVNVVSQYSKTTTDVEVIFFTTQLKDVNGLSSEYKQLFEACDLCVNRIYDSHTYEFKVVKDRKKTVVRDITENGFYCMLGKYYAFDYADRNPLW